MRYFVGPLALLLFIGPASAQEEVVPQDKIPKAVMKALLAKFPKAKIDKCTKAKEGDDIVYDIEFKQDGRKCEADIKENGVYINYEQAIEAKDFPKVVREAIDRKYAKATLKEIMEEKEVKGTDEKISAYEVVLVTADNSEVEVRVSPEGKILEDTGEKKAKIRSDSQPDSKSSGSNQNNPKRQRGTLSLTLRVFDSETQTVHVKLLLNR